MNWLIFGAGAIGTYVGGSLALHGERVVFLEQPGVVEGLRSSGLRLSLVVGEQRVSQPEVYDSIGEALAGGPYELAVFALKSYDTATAVAGLAPFVNQLPTFLCLQNGVENEAKLAGLLGEARVMAGTVTSSIGRRAAGDIVVERLRGIGVAADHPLAAKAVALLDQSGLNAQLYNHPESMKWSKMLTNLLANAIPAILNLTPREVLAHPGLYRLEMQQLREALLVMRAQQIEVVDLPKVRVRLLDFAARRLPLRISQPLLQRVAGGGRGGKMPSLHIDLHSRRGKSEVSYLNGAVSRIGASLGVKTPVNRKLDEILTAMTEERVPIERFAGNPAGLIEMVERGN